MAEGMRSKTLELQFQEFKEDTKTFMASTMKSIADSQRFQEKILRQFDDFKKSSDQRMEQLAYFVRNPQDLGHRREQQSDAADSDRRNIVRGGSELMAADQTLLIKVRLELYPISWENLDKIFSKFGMIEYLEVFCRGEEYHSTIRFQKRESAMEAFESLNHREIYDNWCRLELFLLSLIEPPSLSSQEVTREQHQITNQERAWRQESNQQFYRDLREIIDYDGRDTEEIQGDIPMTVGAPMVGESPGIIDREFKGLSEIVLGEATTELVNKYAVAEESVYLIEDRDQVIDDLSKDLLVHTITVMTYTLKKPESNDDVEGSLTQPNCLKVNPNPSEFIIYDSATKELVGLVQLLIELMEIRWTKFRTDSSGCLRTHSAHKVFGKMPCRREVLCDQCNYSLVDRKISTNSHMDIIAFLWPYDRGKCKLSAHNVFFKMPRMCVQLVMSFEVYESGSNLACFGPRNVSGGTTLNHDLIKLPYDRGKSGNKALSACFMMVREYYNEVATVKKFVFDPGDINPLLARSRGQLSAHLSCLLDLILGVCFHFMEAPRQAVLNWVFDGGVFDESINGWFVTTLEIASNMCFVFDPGITEWMSYSVGLSIATAAALASSG